jgi:hypothetical protein
MLVDKVNGRIVVHPKIFQSFITETTETHYIVQKSVTNAHLTTVKKDWVFLSEEKANKYRKEHADELNQYAKYVQDFFAKRQ